MGVRLPPEQYCLTAPTYQVDPKATLETWKKKGSKTGSVQKDRTITVDEASGTASSESKLSLSKLGRDRTKINRDNDYDMEHAPEEDRE
jgi:hypothetical protein